MSFEYLEAMFWRLHEAKTLAGATHLKAVEQSLAKAHVIAIKCSIRDYLRMHQDEQP
jgi:hypothetical protein